MKARKITIPEAAPSKKRISRAFAAALANPPLVNGKNYFSGSLPNSGGGSMGMMASTQQEWEQMWAVMGQPVPGKLPPGAMAQFHRFGEENARTTLSLMSVKRSGENIHMRWHITHTPASERDNAAFGVIVLPKGASVSQEFKYRNMRSKEDIKAEAAEKTAKRRNEEARNYSPTLKQPLPIPKSIFSKPTQ